MRPGASSSPDWGGAVCRHAGCYTSLHMLHIAKHARFAPRVSSGNRKSRIFQFYFHQIGTGFLSFFSTMRATANMTLLICVENRSQIVAPKCVCVRSCARNACVIYHCLLGQTCVEWRRNLWRLGGAFWCVVWGFRCKREGLHIYIWYVWCSQSPARICAPSIRACLWLNEFKWFVHTWQQQQACLITAWMSDADATGVLRVRGRRWWHVY